MKKTFFVVLSMSIIIISQNYCKEEASSPINLTPRPIKEKKELTIEKTQEEMIKTEETEKMIEVEKPKVDRVAGEQEENIKKLVFLLDDLKAEMNITYEQEIIEHMKPLYLKYDPDAINRSFNSFLEASFVMKPDKMIITEKDVKRFKDKTEQKDPISWFRPDYPRDWGMLTINVKPGANLIWIRCLEFKREEKKEDLSQYKDVLPVGLYEVLAYYKKIIKGRTEVQINSVEEDRDGETINLDFRNEIFPNPPQ